ncbi:MAG: prephenate dehydratase [Epsilonproteobacteria bacterium]|nr:prephenate dehydratase [Campylobacterota bacterium]PIP10140.1 MAG: chloride transporter [Sulfurimonas sp. CG23_combo_of_CG06-09_8_20_14_all_36_33]PIS26541.1 MAG: chloride transporter [Sulfurimonas sp. CG08_land_8_20_14_0_20_36_33]PIU34002.1 MAG: chloride transporter [Sulfurimonas sp. CG07_land_8_20_14_0_80_36_56]PIV03830.1 MAG: chloride transporter [Sulfurimonas sp. CG03_land_8_20_14_0_80_36_25]PIV34025.1 MAG: chloride transporter [Sulfurimonas sp. CG02_land_8_20_14_3_00_36_67]PIV61463.1 M
MKTLEECREAIDTIDNEILKLLNQRMKVVARVGEIKHDNGTAVYRPEREKAIIQRLDERSQAENGALKKGAIEAIYLEIFAVARNLELPERIAFLGPEGSFTHQAAESRFGGMSDYLSLGSIHSVFKTLEAGRAKFGVVPIENSRDGIVGETLDLLAKSSVKIVAELYMPIHMSFVTKANKLEDITKIYSKDKGFGQCRDFLLEHGFMNVEKIPVESTATAAILAAKEPNSAAICSHIAAKLYGVPTLFDNIEDEIDNKTRFVILSNFKNAISHDDKTSILVRLKDGVEAGSLLRFLGDFNDEKINLSKIESRPSKDKSGFGYWFFMDFYGHIDEEKVQKAIDKHKDEVTWLGSYAKGES